MNDITIRRPVKWRSAGLTDVGKVRKINEDAIMSRPDACLWAIADGMGGHEAGDIASKMIVKSLEDVKIDEDLNAAVKSIEECIHDVNRRIIEYSEIMLDGRITGATLVSFLINNQLGVCLWAGDSRLYRFHNNTLEQISRDHSRTEELLKSGLIKPENASSHPESNVITRAVGVSEDLNLETRVFSIQSGDTFLLCSDGLYNSVSNEIMIQYLSCEDPNEAVQGLISAALYNQANDNASVIVLKGVH